MVKCFVCGVPLGDPVLVGEESEARKATRRVHARCRVPEVHKISVCVLYSGCV